MSETEKVLLGLTFVVLAAIVIYNRMGTPISVAPDAVGAGPSPYAASPPSTPAQAIYMQSVSPWGSAPPMMPMIRRASGIAGIPTDSGNLSSMSCGGRCN